MQLSEIEKILQLQDCYPIEWFIDNPYLQNLICPIGKNILKDPVTDIHGHTFCNYCINKWITIKNNCPVSNEYYPFSNQFTKNLNLKNLVQDCQINCLLRDQGCNWKGSVLTILEHVRNSCPYIMVSCQNQDCRVTDIRLNINHHSTQECQHRIQQCTNCRENYKARDRNNHLKECVCRIIKCEHCKDDLQFRDYDNHTKNMCSRILLDCPNKCESKVERRLMQRHKQFECLLRKVTCDRCNENYEFQNEKFHREMDCNQLNSNCKFCGKSMIKKILQSEHLYNCPVCQVQLCRQEDLLHYQTNIKSHFDAFELLKNENTNLHNELNEVKNVVTQLKDIITNLNNPDYIYSDPFSQKQQSNSSQNSQNEQKLQQYQNKQQIQQQEETKQPNFIDQFKIINEDQKETPQNQQLQTIYEEERKINEPSFQNNNNNQQNFNFQDGQENRNLMKMSLIKKPLLQQQQQQQQQQQFQYQQQEQNNVYFEHQQQQQNLNFTQNQQNLQNPNTQNTLLGQSSIKPNTSLYQQQLPINQIQNDSPQLQDRNFQAQIAQQQKQNLENFNTMNKMMLQPSVENDPNQAREVLYCRRYPLINGETRFICLYCQQNRLYKEFIILQCGHIACYDCLRNNFQNMINKGFYELVDAYFPCISKQSCENTYNQQILMVLYENNSEDVRKILERGRQQYEDKKTKAIQQQQYQQQQELFQQQQLKQQQELQLKQQQELKLKQQQEQQQQEQEQKKQQLLLQQQQQQYMLQQQSKQQSSNNQQFNALNMQNQNQYQNNQRFNPLTQSYINKNSNYQNKVSSPNNGDLDANMKGRSVAQSQYNIQQQNNNSFSQQQQTQDTNFHNFSQRTQQYQNQYQHQYKQQQQQSQNQANMNQFSNNFNNQYNKNNFNTEFHQNKSSNSPEQQQFDFYTSQPVNQYNNNNNNRNNYGFEQTTQKKAGFYFNSKN